MNFRWSNIYVLQFLAVLNVNGIKLIPADRTVIKQNGTTRTISRYFLLPHEGDQENPNIARDAGFSKFLREFDKNSERKKIVPGKKKVVDRYRIYIRRKLKKTPKKDLGKSANDQQNKPEVSISTTSTEHIEYHTHTTQVPTKARTFKTPSEADNADDEYIIKKNQMELSAAFPNLLFGEKPAQTRESSENLLDLKVRRTDYPEQLVIEETQNNLNFMQDPYEILKAAAEAQAQNNLGQLKLNGTLDTSEEKIVQTISKASESENESIKIPRPIETLSQAEINDLYAQLYGKYIPGQIASNNNEPREPKSLSTKVNIVVDETAKQIPDHLQKDAAFHLLSALHQTPEKLSEQTVTDTVLNQYKPAEGKELVDKLVETNYEGAQASQILNPSLIINSFDSTSNPVKSKAVLITGEQNNNKIKGNNPLESYFLQFGIQNPDHLFNDESKTIDVSTISSSSSSYDGPNQLSTTEGSFTTGKLPSLLGNVEKGKALLNHPLAGYKGNNSPILLNYNHAGIEHTEPPNFSYSQIIKQVPAGIKGGIEHTQTLNKPVTVNPGGIEFSESMKKPPVSVEISQTVNKPGSLVLNQENIEYSGNTNNPPALFVDQATTESQNSRNPSYDSSSTEYSETIKLQPQQGIKQTENKYTLTKITPPLEGFNIAAGDYSKTSRSPDSMINTPNPDDDDDDVEYKFNTEYILPSTENLELSSINGDVYNTTDENKLRGGIGDEWTTMYQEVEAEDEEQSRQPKIIKSNIVKITGGDEHSRHPTQVQGSIDLATLCPECFQKLQTQFGQKITFSGTGTGTSGINGGSASSVIELIKDSAAVSQMGAIAGQQQGGQNGGSEASSIYTQSSSSSSSSNPSSSTTGSLNGQGLLQFIQKLETQTQQQKHIQISPENDQSLINVLEIVLKDNEGQSSQGTTNLKDAVAQLFTIENLRKVLEALERRKHVQPINDKETGNLYLIIKLILEMAIRHTQVANGNDNSGVFWYQRLSAFMANPLMKYVYNLIRQTWLQEIMIQLYNNNYNLNVIISNPRWATYLGAWRFPVNLMKFINTNYEYYDQNEYGIDYDNLGEYAPGAVTVNPQGDASVILAFLRNYLIRARYYEQNGGVDFYRQQAEIFNRIAVYLRQRGYAVSVIHRIIRKLYAVLNANRALVTIGKPQCISRH